MATRITGRVVDPQTNPASQLLPIWGIHGKVEHSMFGSYEGFASWPLSKAATVSDLKDHPWPTPEW